MRSLTSIVAALLAAAPGVVRAQSQAPAQDPVANLLAAAESYEPAQSGEVALPAAGPLTRDYFLDTVAHDLSMHFKLEGELQLELLRPWTPPARIAGNWRVVITEFPTVASSSMLLRCRIFADAVPVTEASLVLRATLYRDAWVARQPITNGAPFDPAQLETRRVDLFRERDALPAAVGDASFMFARSVNSGRLLTWRDVARRPLVRKGEMVEVSAVEGSLTVTLKALALENGAEGELITVRNLDSRKSFSALVVAENRVQVRF